MFWFVPMNYLAWEWLKKWRFYCSPEHMWADPVVLMHPECQVPFCPLDKLYGLLKDVIVTEEKWKEECGLLDGKMASSSPLGPWSQNGKVFPTWCQMVSFYDIGIYSTAVQQYSSTAVQQYSSRSKQIRTEKPVDLKASPLQVKLDCRSRLWLPEPLWLSRWCLPPV